MKILITGATGTVGREVVKTLYKAENIDLRVAIHKQENINVFADLNIETVFLDYQNMESISNAVNGVSKIFLLTPVNPNMAEMSQNVIDVAKRSGVNFILKISALTADLPDTFLAAKWSGESDNYLKISGVPYSILRPNVFMQNFLNLWTKNYVNSILNLPAGNGKVSFVDVRDIASITKLIITDENGIYKNSEYDLSGPELLDFNEVTYILTEALAKPVRYFDSTNMQNVRSEMNISPWMLENTNKLFEMIREGKLAQVFSTFQNLTNHYPIKFKQFVIDYRKELSGKYL